MASTFTLKTAEVIRDDILRTIRAGLINIGVSNPNVTPGSDYFVLAQSVGDQLEIAMANCQVKADAQMPDTAIDADLARVMAIYGLTFRGASGAAGNVALSSTAATSVTTGDQLIDASGYRFEVAVGGTYANGDVIPIQGVDTGKLTNHTAGDSLRWVTVPPFSASTAVVATGGLTGGVDAEGNETARQRLYARLRNPPASGNWQHVATLAEEASTLVEKAFVHPTVNGPANYGLAVVGYATATSKSRVVPAITVTNVIKPYVDGKYPEHADSIITSVTDSNFDLSVAITIPSSPKATPAGPGGGWTDGTTWPRDSTLSGTFKCAVTSAASSSTFTVDAPSPPTAAVSQIAWLSTLTWTVYTATVTSYTGTSGAYVVTIDKPFAGIAAGDYISPNAVNIQAYFDAILGRFAKNGPGEKASAAYLTARGFRHPTPAQSWPCKIDATMIRSITDSGDEVQDAEFMYRTSTAAPTVPASVSDAPAIFVPRYIGIYEKLT